MEGSAAPGLASSSTDDFYFLENPETPTLAFPTITVDACDVVAVYRVASESIAHARQGFGPTLIDCQHWQGQDTTHNPLLNMRNTSIARGYSTGHRRLKSPPAFVRSWTPLWNRRMTSFSGPLRASNPFTSKALIPTV